MFLATRFRIWSIQEEFLSVGLWRQPISIHANKSAYQWGHKARSIRSHVSLARGMLVFHAFFSLYKIQSHGRAAVLEALEWSTCGAFAGNKMENLPADFPGGPGARIQCSQCRGPSSIPAQGTLDPTWCNVRPSTAKYINKYFFKKRICFLMLYKQ